ncbi:MAG: PIN domain-containing protein [Thiohalomonadales bacterium]
MISIDTNVLLRYLLEDDKKQAALAAKLIEGKRQILITDIVLVETIWTLSGKKYKLKKDDLILIIEQLFKEPNILFEDGQSIWKALYSYRATNPVKVGAKKKNVDFADILILEKSKFDCNKKNEPFSAMYSFDVAAQQIKGIKNP